MLMTSLDTQDPAWTKTDRRLVLRELVVTVSVTEWRGGWRDVHEQDPEDLQTH